MEIVEILSALRHCTSDLGCDTCPMRAGIEQRAFCVATLLKESKTAIIDLLAGIDAAKRRCAQAQAERDALREKQRWIPVAERLPEPETDVLAVCNRNGYIFVILAIYEAGKMLTRDSAWNWSDIYCYGLYDEEADDYYIPEGWWENRQFNPDDVYNNPVDCAVTHWMPLPEAPEGEKT